MEFIKLVTIEERVRSKNIIKNIFIVFGFN